MALEKKEDKSFILDKWFDDAFETGLKVTKHGDEYKVATDLPKSVGKDDVKLSVEDGMLSIKAEKSSTRERKHDGYWAKSSSSYSVYRSVRLPENAPKEVEKYNVELGDSGKVTITFKET